MNTRFTMIALVLFAAAATAARAQSSSLYLTAPQQAPRFRGMIVEPQLQQASLTAVLPPQPRVFALQDLVTIVIREQSSASSQSQLNTNKNDAIDAKVSAFPDLGKFFKQGKLLGGQLQTPTEFKLDFNNDYRSRGDYQRQDTMTTRLTARVVDVKPNGNLVLEARTDIQNDEERSTITVTGTCRPDDISADNSVLSTQLFDLRVDKQHEGTLRRAGTKGLLGKFFDILFNF